MTERPTVCACFCSGDTVSQPSSGASSTDGTPIIFPRDFCVPVDSIAL